MTNTFKIIYRARMRCVCAGSDGAGALVHARFMHISIKGDKGTHVPNLKARVPFA